MALKIVHCADLHIGASFSGLPTALGALRREELREGLENIINYCTEKNVDALIVCGDLFDSPHPSFDDLQFVRKQFSSISPTPVYIVCGNHDYMCSDCAYLSENYFSDNVHIFPCFDYAYNLPEKNTVFWGKSYSSPVDSPTFNDISFDENKINILCLHGDVTSGSDYNTISKDFFTNQKCNYAAFGHIHHGEVFNISNTKCAYSGTPEGHSFSDDGFTGFIYAEIDKSQTDITQVSLSKRKFQNLSFDITFLSTDLIISGIRSLLNDRDFFKITLVGSIYEALNLTCIEEMLSKDAFYLELVDAASYAYDFDLIEKEESLRGRFLQKLRILSKNEEEFSRSAKIGLDALSGIIPRMEEEL